MRRHGEPGASSAPVQDLGSAFAARARAADAPARNEAPRPVAAPAPAPERKGGGVEVEALEDRYDEAVDRAIRMQGRTKDTALIKSAALARKGSFVLSAMAEGKRMQALNRRIEELVGLSNEELAKIANEPMPEAALEAAPKAAPETSRATKAVVEVMPETKSAGQTQLENLSTMEGMGSYGSINTAMLEEVVVKALGDPKTDWTKIDDGFFTAVRKVLEDLKADKQQAAPEYPFLKVNRINGALETIRQEQRKFEERGTAINKALEEATRIARVGEAAPAITGARETATRIADGEIAPTVAREMSPGEEVTHMMKQFNIKSDALHSLRMQLDDYLKTAGLFGGFSSYARGLKRQIRDMDEDLDKLNRAMGIDEKRASSQPLGKIAGFSGARAQAEVDRTARPR